MVKKIIFLIYTVAISFLVVAQEEDVDASASDLAKATQNPVADMYSLPFQNNTIYSNEPHGRAQNVLNIQPVIPVSLGKKVNVINRIIAPVITQPDVLNDESHTGLGDINYTAWFSPKEAGKVIYGVGPAFQLPTATNDYVGTGEFGIGPSLVALSMINQWVAGIVVNNIWTFGDAEENKFLFQYFVNYNLPKAWYLVSGPIITANWNAPSASQWIVPFGGGAGKIVKVGKLPLNINGHVYYNAVKPDAIGDWQTRVQVQFIFPKR